MSFILLYFLLIIVCQAVDDVENEMDEHIQSLLTADFEIGHYIRERIVPNAVLFFTGE
jgi:nucleosome assembly protein 1-like 1